MNNIAQPVYEINATRRDIVQPLTVPATNLHAWLQAQANAQPDLKLRYLLAHALDGVIWGEMRQAVLHLAQSNYTPPFLDDTLQEVRLFGDSAEIHLWRSQNEWHGTLIRPATADETADYTESLDECQILWGDRVERDDPCNAGFSIMTDGIQGLQHVVPLNVADPTPQQAQPNNPKQYKERPLRLRVRHYLAKEDFARIVTSRLVTLTADPQEYCHDSA